MVEYSKQLDAGFAALSNPTRRDIMVCLSRGRMTVTDLAKPYEMSLNAASKHVQVLERAGLVTRWKQGRIHWIEANPEPVARVQDWCAMYANAWKQQFDALDEYLTQTQDEPVNRKTRKKST